MDACNVSINIDWLGSSVQALLIISLFYPTGRNTVVEFEFDASMSVLTLRKPGMNAAADWTILLQ